ncbi:DUF1697 domain-containing protein [Muriicola marianensis]|uniref:DUF1697 domain-containing protein n=1 Tax=Muriicola marianensis TaxID=1324801 RepID=A0ABQ1R2V5_9FLAO|nr:DUF1697 domain-containing protein [Muriicola marianensis]GGD54171.1 hypothetical protein GCM10011361_21080 [Muriicola marianensis]
MVSKTSSKTYIALLRGINVGGHHKMPMAQLKKEMQNMGYTGVITILNSGNVIFLSDNHDTASIQDHISSHLREVFAFEIPTQVLDAEILKGMSKTEPFRDEELNEKTRCYVTFLGNTVKDTNEYPMSSEDGSFKILRQSGQVLYSILDLNKSDTPKAMALVERIYGKGVTTRNWKTIQRIAKKLSSDSK